MSALSNDPSRSEVINLGWGPSGHGPYLVRQEGYLPGSTHFNRQYFVLQKSGLWLINLAFVMLPEAEQEKQLFSTLSEVMSFFEDISTQPVSADDKIPDGSTANEIISHFESCTNRILRGIREGSVVPAGSLMGKSD
jgi:hypothetical protein